MCEFVESAVLTAVMDRDMKTVRSLLADFHPYELRKFKAQVEVLAVEIHRERRRQNGLPVDG